MMLVRMREVPDVVARFLSLDERRMLGLQSSENASPMLDDFRRVTVDVEPYERFTEDAAMRQRPLDSRMRAEVMKPTLEHQRLAKPFDVAASER